VAPFGGSLLDQQPAFSPDGRYLVYVRGSQLGAGELVRVDKIGSAWSQPEPLPEAANISKRISQPSIGANGDIYFNAVADAPGKPKSRLYRSALANGIYQKAEALSFSDGTYVDVDPEIAPDQSYIVFSSKGRKPFNDGFEHLYIAFHKDGVWGAVTPIRYEGDTWSGTGDGNARLGPDGTTLYFTSDRSPPVKVSRTHTEIVDDYARMELWDNGNSNVWTLSISPYMNARTLRPRVH
jgi:Tol biopolymer transport system component